MLFACDNAKSHELLHYHKKFMIMTCKVGVSLHVVNEERGSEELVAYKISVYSGEESSHALHCKLAFFVFTRLHIYLVAMPSPASWIFFPSAQGLMKPFFLILK